MNLDDKICYCYGVSMRKLVHFSRRVRPEPPSRMTECLNAGTGCGWCIPFLIKIARDPDAFLLEELAPEEYAERRKRYIVSEPKNTFEPESTSDARSTPRATDEPGGSSGR